MKSFRIKSGRKTVRPFKKEDINNIMVLCKKRRNQAEIDHKKHEFYMWDRNYMIMVLGINLAFRISDLLKLRVDDVKGDYIYIRETKTRKEQSFPLNPNLKKDIEKYINRNNLIDGEYLFQSREGVNKPISRVRVDQIINDLAKDLNIGYPVGAHSLRKYFARQYYEKTGDIIGLKEMLNHATERVTLLYICWDDEAKDKRRKDFYLGS